MPLAENVTQQLFPEDCILKPLLPQMMGFCSAAMGNIPSISMLSYQPPTLSTVLPPANAPASLLGLPFREPASPNARFQCHYVELCTVEQGSSKELMALHQHTVTASNFKRVVVRRSQFDKLANSLFNSPSLINVLAIQP